jgi:cytochrome c
MTSRVYRLGWQSVAGLAGALLLVTGRAADLEHGEELFVEHCAACHTVIERVRDKSGPNLYGLLGRQAGTEEYSAGFSDELVASQITWQLPILERFLIAPARMVRGTTMVYRGLADAEARRDLVCYLERVGGGDGEAPSAVCAE